MVTVRSLLTRARTALRALTAAWLLAVGTASGAWAADTVIYQTPVLLNQAAMASGTTYWDVGAWSLCSAACGSTGTQTRAVACINNGVPAADVVCAAVEAKPGISQACSDYRSCAYTWQVTNVGTCSNTCGTGSQTRDVYCVRSFDGAVVADAACTAAKPSSAAACTDNSSCTYRWMTGAWGACSTACGTGTQTRGVVCQKEDGANVANALCSATAPPPLTQSCTVVTGCSFAWAYSAWSACSAGCGSGVQTRTASCQRSDGTIVADANCTAPKAALSQACSNFSACTYSWVQAWGSCSTSCGVGTQSTVNNCSRSDGMTVANASCTTAAPAGLTQSCSAVTGCSFAWTYSAWSACSAGCGSGVQTRTALCRRSDGTIVADANCTAPKATLSRACTDYTSCTYSWTPGSWGTCSTTCGTGTQSRTNSCTRSDGARVANALCPAGAPATSQACTVMTGCATPAADLSITLSGVGGSVSPGSVYTLIITVRNSGTVAGATGSNFNLGGSVSGGTLGAPSCTAASGASCGGGGGYLPPGGTVTLSAPLTITSTLGSYTLTGTVQGTSGLADPVPANNTSTVSFTVADIPVLKTCMFTSPRVGRFLGCSTNYCDNGGGDGNGVASATYLGSAWLLPELFDGWVQNTSKYGSPLYLPPTSARWKTTGKPVTNVVSNGNSAMVWPIVQVWNGSAWVAAWQNFAGGRQGMAMLAYWSGAGSNPGTYYHDSTKPVGTVTVVSSGVWRFLSSGGAYVNYKSEGMATDGQRYRQVWMENSPGQTCAVAGTTRVQ